MLALISLTVTSVTLVSPSVRALPGVHEATTAQPAELAEPTAPSAVDPALPGSEPAPVRPPAPPPDAPLSPPNVEQGAPRPVRLAQALDWRAASPSGRQFPRPSLLRFLENCVMALTRPVRPELTDVFVIVPTIAGTAVALNTDVDTHRAIQHLPDPRIAGHELSYWASYLGEGWVDVAVFVALGVLGGRNEQRAAVAGIQALMVVGLVSRVGKLAFRLERPSYDPDHQHFFSDRVMAADAMPSGHTMSAFATAAVLAREYPKAAPIFYALAGWCALARVQQSTHWVSDTIVGAALGLLIGWESWNVTRAFELEVDPWVAGGGAGLTVARSF